MPVPVPPIKSLTHANLKYPTSKQSSDTQASFHPPVTFGSSLTSDNFKYVIQRPFLPVNYESAFISGSSQSTQPNWPDLHPIHNFGDNSFTGQISEGASVARESTSYSHGLIGAGNASVSKQGHAEAFLSPVSQTGSVSSNMGLQQCPDAIGTFEPMWSSYGADGNDSRSHSLGLDIWNSMHIDRCPQLLANENLGRGYKDSNKQITDTAMQQKYVTPFADYIDRIVASGITRSCDPNSMDVPEDVCQPDACHKVTLEPLSNPAYIREYRLLAEPLSEWMSDFVWKVCSSGMSLPHRYIGSRSSKFYPDKPSCSLAKSIHAVLCSTLLQPSTIALALWYITKLPVIFHAQSSNLELNAAECDFRRELFGEGCHSPGDQIILEAQAPFRIALLGCMLANKWLDDHTFSNKTWHTVSEVPIQSINRLELAALNVLGHDLSVPALTWGKWLIYLRHYQSTISPYPAPIRRPSTYDAAAIIRKMIDDLVRLHSTAGLTSSMVNTVLPVFSPLLVCDGEKKTASHQPPFEPFDIDINLDEDGPLREEYVPKRRSSRTGGQFGCNIPIEVDPVQNSSCLPPPSEWSPQADPPLERNYRRPENHYGILQSASNASHVRSFSATCAQTSAWISPPNVALGTSDFVSHFGESRVVRSSSFYQPFGTSFSIATVCPPVSNTRSTQSASGQLSSHIRTYSQIFNGPEGCLPSGNLPFSYGQADHLPTRPLWLRA